MTCSFCCLLEPLLASQGAALGNQEAENMEQLKVGVTGVPGPAAPNGCSTALMTQGAGAGEGEKGQREADPRAGAVQEVAHLHSSRTQ